MSLTLSKGFWAPMLLSLMVAGCKCNEPSVVSQNSCRDVENVQEDHLTTCSDNSECADHYICRAAKDREGLQCCTYAFDRSCTTEADCCAGQSCSGGRCFDKQFTKAECSQDSDCGPTGDRFCEDYTGRAGVSKRCRFKTCGANGECADGLSCFQGECMAELPCGGSCEPGKACFPTADYCQNYANPKDRSAAACPMSCAPGFIATFKDGRNIWDSCSLPDVACVCAELPGIKSNDLGRYSALAADPGKALYVSAYDGQFGDLTVSQFGLDGQKQSISYIDGVPSTGKVTYGPNGPRGGVLEVGPDVGRYTDIAVHDGQVYVSYYDVTRGNLKLALRNAAGQWATHDVDGANGDVGLYSSLALDADGKPGIAYFQRSGEGSFNVMDCPLPRPTAPIKYITALKFAKAKTTAPSSASDWVISTLSCQARPEPICDECKEVCANPGSGAVCLPAATGCAAPPDAGTSDGGCDLSSNSCVTLNGNNVCAKTVTPVELQQIVPGVGLFPSLAFKGKAAVIVCMVRSVLSSGATDGDLYGITVSETGAVGTPVLIDAKGDTGYSPDLKIEGQTGQIAIGYHDFTSKAFKFYLAPQLQAGITPEIIDTGIEPSLPGSQSWVGSDSAIVFGPSGVIWALYQDATQGDLKLAKRTNSWVIQGSPRTTGAVGFFADAVLSDGKLYTSHARIHAKMVRQESQVDNSLLFEVLSPP